MSTPLQVKCLMQLIVLFGALESVLAVDLRSRHLHSHQLRVTEALRNRET